MPTKAHLLYRAAKAGDEAEAVRLLDQGADPKKYKNEYVRCSPSIAPAVV